jgi:dTDP-4-amino-4,6-dideoxygalactose transaminase
MKVPLLDLKIQYQSIREEIMAVTEKIYESQYFILGEYVKELEGAIAEYCHTKYAVGVSSGSDALIISLMAADVCPGDIVLTTPYTFFATAGAVARLNAIPVFVDIDLDTFNISPKLLEQTVDRMSPDERRRVKAVIPVHLYGQCAEMNPISQLADANHWVVIEDAAQAIGSEYKGRRAGSMGTFGCFSFFPSKNLGAFGDGGIVTVQSESRYRKLRILRGHGAEPKYIHHVVGGNFRLDALQAAIVSIKLKYLDQWTAGRQANAETYRGLFSEMQLLDRITLPREKENRHIYNQFVVMVPEKRDDLRRFLNESGIGTEIYYPMPLHRQECFSYLQYQPNDFPVSEHAASHSLALPIYPELTIDQQQYVVEKIKEFYSTS